MRKQDRKKEVFCVPGYLWLASRHKMRALRWRRQLRQGSVWRAGYKVIKVIKVIPDVWLHWLAGIFDDVITLDIKVQSWHWWHATGDMTLVTCYWPHDIVHTTLATFLYLFWTNISMALSCDFWQSLVNVWHVCVTSTIYIHHNPINHNPVNTRLPRYPEYVTMWICQWLVFFTCACHNQAHHSQFISFFVVQHSVTCSPCSQQ